MRSSPVTDQNVTNYLDLTGSGTLFTPGTFLAYTLRGKAKAYSGHYLRRMMDRLMSDPGVVAVQSVGGSTAYIRKEDRPS